MGKYKAKKIYDQKIFSEIYFVEKTDERYGFPAVLIPEQPKFLTYQEASDFANKLNERKTIENGKGEN